MRTGHLLQALPQMDADVERLRTILPYSAIVLVVYGLYRAYTYVFPATLLHKLPGPTNGHFFLGHLPEIFDSASGDAQQRWVDQYGHVMAYRAFLNVRANCPASFPKLRKLSFRYSGLFLSSLTSVQYPTL
jgi:hypothetical protein